MYSVVADIHVSVSVPQVVGDSTFVAPAVKLAKLLGRRSDVFLYTFNHVSRLSSSPQWMGKCCDCVFLNHVRVIPTECIKFVRIACF